MILSANGAVSVLQSGLCRARLFRPDQKGQLLAGMDTPKAGRSINHEVILWTDGKR